jgi:hypothetical protein
MEFGNEEEKYSLFKVRHPGRSEAVDVLFPRTIRPSAVEGLPLPCEKTPAAREARFTQSHARRLREIATLWVNLNASRTPGRSFDFGSAQLSGKTHAPLAFAQDDGAVCAIAYEENGRRTCAKRRAVARDRRARGSDDLRNREPVANSLRARRPAVDGYHGANP